MNGRKRAISFVLALVTIITLASPLTPASTTEASNPGSGTLNTPQGNGTTTTAWTGGPYTAANPALAKCLNPGVDCDTFTINLNVPGGYWTDHEGNLTVEIFWPNSTDIFSLFIWDAAGNERLADGSGTATSQKATVEKPAGGAYVAHVIANVAANASYSGRASLTGTFIPPAMKALVQDENKDKITGLLTVDYPINVIFAGYHPTPEEVAELKYWIPEQYKPTVAGKSPSSLAGQSSGDEEHQEGAGLLNWNKNHYIEQSPYFLGIKYNYVVNIIQAGDEYARALFQVAEDNTAQSQAFHTASRGQDLARYDALYGHFRVLARNNDITWKVLDPTKTDLIDAYAVEDWIFNTRNESRWSCAFTNLETGQCLSPSIIQPDPNAYHDPYYDRYGLNLDKMPQGVNKGTSFFFFDTFSPAYAGQYFRSNAYHTWGTDKVINGAIVPASTNEGGSWRITDPDSGAWDGVDYARTWGGRYRFHFIDVGAAPNNYESATWLGAERQLSSDYPHGDPPVWQYMADPRWQQGADEPPCTDPALLNYTGNTPCRFMPRMGRDVAYGLFFRSTAGYLYRPIPRGDVYWLAVSNWTDFYSRPQWVNGQLTNLPWYGAWWTNPDVLYKINQAGNNGEDVLRWLSSAMPYAKWVGRKGETITIYDPTNNQPTNRVLDTSPKYEDLPAPAYKLQQGTTGLQLVPEPLYPGDDNHVHRQYGSSTVDLTEVSNAVERAKAMGIGFGMYDDAVDHTYMRDYIDAHRPGIADIVTGTNGITTFPLVNTIPSVNMVFEKLYTWALPAIVGGIAADDGNGEAWGVFNNVNDRVKWSRSHYPAAQPGDPPGSKRSVTDASLPTQDSGTGFSYTIEHEAAHNLGLSHPHDGSFGVDRCPDGEPNAGEWECYWSGLGYMFDISAAPTTYAMSYRPYEVEDQDNLQRGHVAEYLVGVQEVLIARVTAEANAGRTTPSAGLTDSYNRMVTWRNQASQLFRAGDYLHAEYAARNAALAMRGFAQTAANTSNPRLVEAGQVYFFNVNPQGGSAARPDLQITDVVATQDRPGETRLTATVANTGNAAASNVVVALKDGATVLHTSAPVASLASGATAQVSYNWNTRGQNGEHTINAIADPANIVAESNENNNQGSRTITIRGNKVSNGSFEQSSGGAPSGWVGTQGTGYETGGSNASDGTDSARASGSGGPATVLNPAWTSAPIPVTAGRTYNLAMTVKTQGLSTAPRLNVVYLDAVGNVLNTVTGITSNLTGTRAAQQVLGQVTIPQGVVQVRLKLLAFSPTDLTTQGTVWFDDVWMW